MIFFDIDGTLLDHDAAERQAAVQFASENNIDRSSDEAFVEAWHDAAERYMNQYLDGKITFVEQRHLRLQEILGRELRASEAKELFSSYLAAYESSWRLFDDVLPCLNGLNQPPGIITNGNRGQQVHKLQKTGVIRYFSTIVTSEEISHAKPAVEIFQAACSMSRESPQDCTYVGDRLNTDAEGAVQAGWKGIWLNRVETATPTHSDVIVIKTLLELVD